MNADTSTKPSVKSISIFAAFALSVGTSIGWGSFVVTGSSYLLKAGPIGSVIGILIGMLIMFAIAFTYHYMINKYPHSGGLYTYVKNVFGSDHAFLSSWFLLIIYIAILWANLSSVALFARYLFGSTFQFGYLYSLGGYDVYVGEILLCVGFLLVVGLCLLLKKRILANLQFVLVAFFVVAVLIVFIVSMAKHDGGSEVFSPQFVPGKNPLLEILGVIQLSPWAFVGFESIAQSASDFKFQHKNTLKLFLVSIGVSTLIYIAMCLFVSGCF